MRNPWHSSRTGPPGGGVTRAGIESRTSSAKPRTSRRRSRSAGNDGCSAPYATTSLRNPRAPRKSESEARCSSTPARLAALGVWIWGCSTAGPTRRRPDSPWRSRWRGRVVHRGPPGSTSGQAEMRGAGQPRGKLSGTSGATTDGGCCAREADHSTQVAGKPNFRTRRVGKFSSVFGPRAVSSWAPGPSGRRNPSSSLVSGVRDHHGEERQEDRAATRTQRRRPADDHGGEEADGADAHRDA